MSSLCLSLTILRVNMKLLGRGLLCLDLSMALSVATADGRRSCFFLCHNVVKMLIHHTEGIVSRVGAMRDSSFDPIVDVL
jgi:hypothetical protein